MQMPPRPGLALAPAKPSDQMKSQQEKILPAEKKHPEGRDAAEPHRDSAGTLAINTVWAESGGLDPGKGQGFQHHGQQCPAKGKCLLRENWRTWIIVENIFEEDTLLWGQTEVHFSEFCSKVKKIEAMGMARCSKNPVSEYKPWRCSPCLPPGSLLYDAALSTGTWGEVHLQIQSFPVATSESKKKQVEFYFIF